MKTDDLIRVLATDKAPAGSTGTRMALGLLAALGLSTAAFLAAMGLRPNRADPAVVQAILFKLGVTVPFAVAALVCAWHATRPGRSLRAHAWLFAVPLAVLAGALMLEMHRRGLDRFAARLFGENYWGCLMAIPLLSLAPLAALLFALRKGAPATPSGAGALAGMAAAGLGASLYALHCPDDSPLFILAWYSLSGAMMAGAGAVIGRRALAW